MVGGLAALSSRGHAEAQPFAEAFRLRLDALARAHDYVRPNPDGTPELARTVQGLMRVLLEPYLQEGRERIVIEGADAPIGEKSASALALIMHEQATNAMKYGALSTESGRVGLVGEEAGGTYALTWREQGGPPVAGPPSRQGFGTLMAARSVTSQLGGTLAHEWHRDGLRVTLAAPLARLAV